MKRRDLMRRIRAVAKDRGVECSEIEGGAHTKVTVGDRTTVIPRHREVNELTARAILRQIGDGEAGT